MNSETPIAPSLPTTAISADAPSFITYSSETIAVRGEIDVAQRGAGFVEHHAERHRHQLQMREQPLALELRQRIEYVVSRRGCGCSHLLGVYAHLRGFVRYRSKPKHSQRCVRWRTDRLPTARVGFPPMQRKTNNWQWDAAIH